MLNLWGKKPHGRRPRDADNNNHRNDVPSGRMEAQVQEVVALFKAHRLTPLPSEIEPR